MTDVRATPVNTAAMSRPKERRTAEKKPPLRVLAVVDGSESSGRVTKYLLDLHARDVAFEVVLLNVQPMAVFTVPKLMTGSSTILANGL